IIIKAATITEPTTGAIITAQYTGTGNVSAASASSPGAAPSGKEGIGKFVEVTKSATLNINWVYITIPYTESDLPSGVDESSLKIYYWTGTEWAVCDNTGVDTANKVVYANVTHLTIFAPMAEKAAAGEEGVEGGVGIGGYWWVAVLVAVIIVVVMGVGYSRRKKRMGVGRVVSAEEPLPTTLPPTVPKPMKPSKAEVAAKETAAELENRLNVLKGEIRRLLGYSVGDLKEEAGKISDMIKNGYWVQAGDALATLEGKVMDRKTEKDRYDQFIARVNEWVKERPDLFVDDIKAHLSKGDFDKAVQLLGDRRRDYERYLELGKSLKDVEEQTTMLSTRLAKGELTSDAYERARNDLDRRKYDIDEELWKIQRKIFREKYEKPF
ncbi:MAG: hypothetical protein L6265_05870, partial [Thermoplasmatales archaeon]|nr:hypothetical protein [Thermoplasmatales archaeon]